MSSRSDTILCFPPKKIGCSSPSARRFRGDPRYFTDVTKTHQVGSAVTAPAESCPTPSRTGLIKCPGAVMSHTVWWSLGPAPSAPMPPSTDVLDVQRPLCGHGLWERNRVLQGQREAADRGGGGDGNYADKPPHPFTPCSLVAIATGPSCRTALEVAVGERGMRGRGLGGCRGLAEIKETVLDQ